MFRVLIATLILLICLLSAHSKEPAAGEEPLIGWPGFPYPVKLDWQSEDPSVIEKFYRAADGNVKVELVTYESVSPDEFEREFVRLGFTYTFLKDGNEKNDGSWGEAGDGKGYLDVEVDQKEDGSYSLRSFRLAWAKDSSFRRRGDTISVGTVIGPSVVYKDYDFDIGRRFDFINVLALFQEHARTDYGVNWVVDIMAEVGLGFFSAGKNQWLNSNFGEAGYKIYEGDNLGEAMKNSINFGGTFNVGLKIGAIFWDVFQTSVGYSQQALQYGIHVENSDPTKVVLGNSNSDAGRLDIEVSGYTFGGAISLGRNFDLYSETDLMKVSHTVSNLSRNVSDLEEEFEVKAQRIGLRWKF